MTRYLSALLLLVLLSGCGQKGPLYLPQDDAGSPRQDYQPPASQSQPAP